MLTGTTRKTARQVGIVTPVTNCFVGILARARATDVAGFASLFVGEHLHMRSAAALAAWPRTTRGCCTRTTGFMQREDDRAKATFRHRTDAGRASGLAERGPDHSDCLEWQ